MILMYKRVQNWKVARSTARDFTVFRKCHHLCRKVVKKDQKPVNVDCERPLMEFQVLGIHISKTVTKEWMCSKENDERFKMQ